MILHAYLQQLLAQALGLEADTGAHGEVFERIALDFPSKCRESSQRWNRVSARLLTLLKKRRRVRVVMWILGRQMIDGQVWTQ